MNQVSSSHKLVLGVLEPSRDPRILEAAAIKQRSIEDQEKSQALFTAICEAINKLRAQLSHLDRFRERLVRLRYKHRAQMFTMVTEQTRAKVAEQPIENLLVEGAKRLRMLFASLATVEHHLSENKGNLAHNLRELKVNHQAIERLEDEVLACRQACRDDSVQTVANFVDLRRLSTVQRQSLADRLEAIQERWAVSQSLLSSQACRAAPDALRPS